VNPESFLRRASQNEDILVLCTSRMRAWDVGDVVRSRWIGGGGLGSLTQEDDFKHSVPSMHFSHLHVCPIWLKEKERLLAVCFRLGACKFNSDRMLYTYLTLQVLELIFFY